MEPLRCFPQFIQSIPYIVQRVPNCQIEIAGIDEINYGGLKPPQGTWGKWAKEFLKSKKCSKCVNWVGRLPIDEYYEWLIRSNCHVYLSEPFVASWSLMDALTLGVNLVASNNESVQEFCKDQDKCILVNDKSPIKIAKAVEK